MEIDPPFKENHATAEDWRKALHNVVPAVVVLRTTACRALGAESAGASYATRFVVDKRRGVILTNRHVGPVVAEATFVNMQETPVYPMYREGVHDFGLFREQALFATIRRVLDFYCPFQNNPYLHLCYCFYATFVHKGFGEPRRLGLQTETEQLVRHATPLSGTGMPVVDSVVPGGPAY